MPPGDGRSRFDLDLSVRDGGGLVVTPFVDGRSLVDIAADFERARGYTPAGGYGGLIPEWFNYGPLDQYLLGESTSDLFADGVWVLGCGDCGEVGCWPLRCRIEAGPDRVVWRNFAQPYRKEWDYGGLGPFVFERAAYEATVRAFTARMPGLNR